jgi:hypothetical protein
MKRRFEMLACRMAAEAPYGGFVGDPETHGIEEPRGGGFSIMQDLQRDLAKEQGRTAALSIPSLGGWNRHAGGTGVEEGYYGYDFSTDNVAQGGRRYSIQPASNSSGYFMGYFLSVFPGANHGHAGIDAGGGEVMVNSRQSLFRSPVVAVRAAQAYEAASRTALAARQAADGLGESAAMDPVEAMAQYTADVGKELLRLRRQYGFMGVRQGYRGTGSQRAKRQLFVRLPTDESVDVWLETRGYQIGGVTLLGIRGSFPYGGRTPAEVAKDVADKLKALAERPRTATERTATGEMSRWDIKPGGDDYGWAQMVEKAAKQLQRLTRGNVRFQDVRPFDKYQGPYAQMSQGSLWSGENEGEFYLDLGAGKAGTVEDIADWVNEGMPRAAADFSGLRSRRAMYWGAPGRTYRLTRGEQENGVATCPRCKAEMEREPFTRGERMWVCPGCRFKVPTSKAVTKIEIEMQPDGEVEVGVTTAGGEGKRAQIGHDVSPTGLTEALNDWTDAGRQGFSKRSMCIGDGPTGRRCR